MINNELTFAQRVANTPSVQALVRAMDVFRRKYNDVCVIELKQESGGIVVSFGTNHANDGHEKFLKILEESERLSELVQEFKYAQVFGAPKEHVEQIEAKALEIGQSLYPETTFKNN